MPLPLLLSSFASTGVSTTSVGSIVGAAVSGFAAGLAGYWYYCFNSDEELTEEHQASLDDQNRLTEQRIVSVQTTVESVPPKLRGVAEQVKQANAVTSVSVSELRQSSESMLQTGNGLMEVVLVARRPSDSGSVVYVQLESLMRATYEYAQETTAKIEELNSLLRQKRDELTQVQCDMRLLKATLDAQVESIAALTHLVKTVTTENEQYKQTVEQQDLKIKRLKPQISRLVEQNRFFKKTVQQTLTAQIAPTTEASMVFNT